jgi:hypothetical protein
MTDIPGAKGALEPSGISPWRRVLVAVCNLGCFVVIMLLAPGLSRFLAGEGAAWWIGVPILLAPLVAVDVLLYWAILLPERRNQVDPGAAADGPRE